MALPLRPEYERRGVLWKGTRPQAPARHVTAAFCHYLTTFISLGLASSTRDFGPDAVRPATLVDPARTGAASLPPGPVPDGHKRGN